MLTPMGRCEATRTFLMSQLNHYHAIRPISVDTQKRMEKVVNNFVNPIRKGNKKAHIYINANDAQADKINGGINMPSIQKSLHSYNVGWLKKLYYKQHEDLHWIHILRQDINTYRRGFKLEWLFDLSIDGFKNISRSTAFNNPFWKSVCESAAELLKSNNIGNNNSIINMKWDENPLLLEIDPWPPYTKKTDKERLKRINKDDYSRMANCQIQHYYPRDAIMFNGIIDHETAGAAIYFL